MVVSRIEEFPRIALIGCGRWGKNIARSLSAAGALELIVDPYADALTGLAKDLGARLSNKLADAFAPHIRAVAIAAPAVQHASLVRRALLAGKHVFVEKPLAMDVSEAEELAALADERELTLMVGHLLQYHPAFLELCRQVERGAIGEVRHVSSNRLNPGAIRIEENALWSMAPHDFSMILGLLGGYPEVVDALAVRVVDPMIPDQFFVHMRFGEFVTGQANVSWLSPYKEHKLTVLGTRGALVFEDTVADPERRLLLYRDYVDAQGRVPAFVKGPGEPVPYERIEPLLNEMRWFLDCVEAKRRPRSGPAEAIPVLRLLRDASAAAGLAVA
ncbi:Gfo/Idh/MocA family oxidoreductase [Pseudaminobacter sp. 19-2017]|uniref:Gfo/Idh/MocA family oxidoreductase n=1 Tax=Pseudaminobacter soli (ex Zhang et al. 2022) TaxID=2831468 RepID=A0A942I1T3_9HYPH|nr:Gfo/Idh/MocA family oxidoreductase [Pseudaminobacter soli]MBS3648527.1 Gfo/Idh/MocA family oxidoreductase [Pseudaminobacter soli]